MNLGNYEQALKSVSKYGNYFEIVMQNVQEGWKADKCRIVDLSDKNLDVGDINRIFNLKSDSDREALKSYVD